MKRPQPDRSGESRELLRTRAGAGVEGRAAGAAHAGLRRPRARLLPDDCSHLQLRVRPYSARVVALVAPGVLWVAIVFGGVVGLTRSFSLEKDNGSLTGLMLAPVSRDTIYFGKMFAAFLFMVAVEIIVFPVFIVLYDVAYAVPEMVPVALLTTLGIATVGTLFSAMAVNTRAREVMLPILFFPVALPIVVAAVEVHQPGAGARAGRRGVAMDRAAGGL